MEGRRRGRPGIFLGLGILMILSASSTSEEEMRNIDGYSIASDACTIPCHEKWVAKTYFDKYGSLDDAAFEHYRDVELSRCSCEMLPRDPHNVFKLSDLDRHLTGEGSHRSLFTSFRISVDEEFAAKSPFRFYQVVLVERLPSGVFADPFELQHIQDRGVYGEVAVFGDTNLELPSFLSNSMLVEVHMSLSPNSLLEQKNGLEIKVEVPVHARYQALDGSGYSVVQFGEPDVFARCSMEKWSSNQSHLFVLTSNGAAVSYKNPIVWKIPSGIETHAGFVSVVTFLSASLSALVIIVASVFHSNIKLHKNVKTS
ncbi:hypothetical protein BT93_E0169 [Corymbia citriodora subsp. variegata]|nr:hypothetical protein BT93_E0169 [Corymbia citriodora subsp. variegata]KAF8027170.1 hypothetical protein BT93_E0169 [Corymbia citriodora subsp. variegata]KAF8027171.1 hypothetical protein BT93_E0169 [Corymbia citriodora subsp. variegata]